MKPTKVIVAVSGGMANPVYVPAGVELEIRDYDNARVGEIIDGYDSDGNGYTSDVTVVEWMASDIQPM